MYIYVPPGICTTVHMSVVNMLVYRKGNRLYSVEANWTPVDMKTNKPIENISQDSEPRPMAREPINRTNKVYFSRSIKS